MLRITSTLPRDLSLPVRLLGIGLPLTIVAEALAAAAIFDQMTIGEAVILAVMPGARPTRPWAMAVVHRCRGSRPGSARALNVESGLNDGICVPLLFVGIVTAQAADVGSHVSEGGSAA